MPGKMFCILMTLVILQCAQTVTSDEQRQEIRRCAEHLFNLIRTEARQIHEMFPDPGNSIRVALQELKAAEAGVHMQYRLSETVLNTDTVTVDSARISGQRANIDNAFLLHRLACAAVRSSSYDAVEVIAFYNNAHDAFELLEWQTLALCRQLYLDSSQRLAEQS